MVSPKFSIALLVSVLTAYANVAYAQNIYCCHELATGRKICADVLPVPCKGQSYKIYDVGGNLLREVGPPLTQEQKAAKAAEERRKREQEEALRELRRKDAALLQTYSSLQDIDLSLTRAEVEFTKVMKRAQENIDVAKNKRKQLEREAEFYKKHDLPPELARAMRDVNDEIRSHTSVLVSKKSDLDSVRAKFTADRKRYLEIMAGGGMFSHPDAKRKVEVIKK